MSIATKLLKAAFAYYWLDDPVMPDGAYDELWKQFNASDEEHPLITTKGDTASSLFYISHDDLHQFVNYATIPRKEYESLQARADTLAKLEAAGVYNWEWYGEALCGDDGEDG